MSTLRISDAPLLPDVDGTEKIPTGGRGDYAISVDQIKDHIFQDVGKELVGLGNVDNTSDLDKPVSTAQQAALNIKADKTYVDTNLNLKADKTNVYTRSETSLALSQKADLVGGVIPSNQLPSYVDDVVEYTTNTLPIVGESGKIYVTTDNNKTWRWSGNQYVEISNGGVSDSTLKLQTPRKIASVDFDGTQDISIPHNNLTGRDVVDAHTASSITDVSGTDLQALSDNVKRGTANKFNLYITENGGYAVGDVVLLNDGTEVISTAANNVVDPNVDMTGWMVANSGVASLDALRLIDPKTKGRRIYLNSVITGKELGGGVFVSTQKAGITDNGGTIVASPNPSLFWVRINYDVTTPQMFGALGDNENDDRPPFQAAVDFLRNSGGGELYVPRPKNQYVFKSYDNVNNCALLLEAPIEGVFGNPVTLRGAGRDVRVRLNLGLSTTIDSMVLLKGGGSFKSFENLTFWGGPSSSLANCNYTLKGIDAYYPDFDMSNCQFYSAVESTVRLATYVSIFNKVRGGYAKKFMHITGPEGNLGGEVTSLTFNSCYGLNVTEHSIYLGTATYCTFNACAADHVLGANAYPYYINLARGVAFNGCGAESSDRIMHIGTAQGVTINGLMTLAVGNNENPPAELIRIDGGASVTISSFWPQSKKASQCILRLGGNFSTESLTVLDQSLEPSDVIAPSNFRFQNPVRFLLRDFSRKTQETVLTNTGNATTNTANFRTAVLNAYDTCLLHDVIVRFPSGDFEVNDIVYLSSPLTRGEGRIRLIGNADGTSRLVATGSGIVSFGRPNSVNAPNFTVENLTLHMSAPAGTTKGIQFYKGTTTFTNGKITSDNGSRQYYTEGEPVLKLGSGSYIATPYLGAHDVQFIYKATTAPTNSTRLPAGTIFRASDPNATRYAWINTAEGGATWLAMTP